MNALNKFLTAALKYDAAGFSVIPVRPRDKAPLPVGWQRYSTARSTKEEIERWWKDTPNANVGIALGHANGTDGRYLFVVDQDVLKDEKRMPILNADGSFKQKGDMSGCPATVSQTTGSGGKQFFYWAPKGYAVGNSKPRPLIDVKGFAGQVLVPPSIHPDTGKEYTWDIDELSRDLIAEFPQDALDALLGEKATSASSTLLPISKVLGGVPIGQGLRHMGIAQVAGHLLRGARTPEAIELARLSLYTWDKEKNKSPERWEERKRELDNTFDSILKRETTKQESEPRKWIDSKPSHASKPIFSSYADIKTSPIDWLWEERIAIGKLTMIVGDPGLGKSSITTGTIAATVSKGGSWPVDNTQSPLGDVILLSAEDDAADTVKPRLEAAGADCTRVHTLQAVRDVNPNGSSSERMFSLKRDIAALEEMLDTLPKCKVVIVDPISAYLDDTDSHRNAAVRGLLAPLAALAVKHKVAIIVVDHLNKNSGEHNSLYRAGGSLGFVAAARAVYLVAKDKENPERRLMVPIKNNIAKENTALAYTVTGAPNGAAVIVWEADPVRITANEILGSMESEEQRSDTDWAVIVLRQVLFAGPLPAKQVFTECKQAGLGEKQVRRAGKKLGINPKKIGFNQGWTWALPDREDAPQGEEAQPTAGGILADTVPIQDTDVAKIDEEIPF
ncbi:MAG: bifunctional DNA primase/polymerase [bacterium]|nr:bifunctional DNA primase/polymerase [bacterium]